jgi:hypothetical protein
MNLWLASACQLHLHLRKFDLEVLSGDNKLNNGKHINVEPLDLTAEAHCKCQDNDTLVSIPFR